MILKQGILARKSLIVNTFDQHTLYKCPADRSAVGRLMFFHNNLLASGSTVMTIANDGSPFNNGIRIWASGSLNVGDKIFTVGIKDRLTSTTITGARTGATADTTLAPSGVVHMLGPGDEIRYTAANSDFDFRFVGMEISDIIKTAQFAVSAIGTTTLYTCPVGKTAAGRFLFFGSLSTSGSISFLVNEVVVATFDVGLQSIWSNQVDGVIGYSTASTSPTGMGTTSTIGPSGALFHLDEGDIVQARVNNTTGSMRCAFLAWENDKYA